MTIRPATLDDAEQVAALADRTFRDAFTADNDPADIDAYAAEAFSLGQTRAELADDANTFLLACAASDAPIGYAKLRRGPAEPCVTGSAPVELQRIYVDLSAVGQGIGATLLVAVLDVARSGGFRTLWLGVWDRNARAIRFYQREGFEIVGSHPFRLGSDDQTDLILKRLL